MKKVLALVIMFVFLAGSVLAAAEKLTLPLDKKKLEAGKLQTFVTEFKVEQGKKKRVVGVLLINAPPEKVWEVLIDWPAQTEYVAGLDYYKIAKEITPITKTSVGEQLISGKLDVPLLSISYTLEVKFDSPNMRQEWKLVTEKDVEEWKKKGIVVAKPTGGLKNVEGFEYIEPYDNAAKTVFYYAPIVETSLPMPGFLERILARNTLSGFVEGVKKRVESNKTYKK